MAFASGFCLKMDSCNLSILSWAAPLRRCTGEAICISFNEVRKPWSLWVVHFRRPQNQLWGKVSDLKILCAINCMRCFPWYLHLSQCKASDFTAKLGCWEYSEDAPQKLITIWRKSGPITRNTEGIELLFVEWTNENNSLDCFMLPMVFYISNAVSSSQALPR